MRHALTAVALIALAACTGGRGAVGPQGPPGLQGDAGMSGSPDTPDRVLAKLLTVDGAGSGLDADRLDGHEASELQTRIDGSCPEGSFMRGVSQDGGVDCAAEASYSAGPGLTLNSGSFGVDSSQVQARITQSCPLGQAIRAVNGDGSVSCGPFTTITVVPGNDTPTNNGRHLYDTLNSVQSTRPTQPVLLFIEPGVYDLGNLSLWISVPNLSITGAGREATVIQFEGSRGLEIDASVSLASFTLTSGRVATLVESTSGQVQMRDVAVLDPASGADAWSTGVEAWGSSISLDDCDVEVGGGYAISAADSGAKIVVQGGRIGAPTYALDQDDPGATIRVANAIVSGGLYFFRTNNSRCVNTIKADYSGVLTNACQ